MDSYPVELIPRPGFRIISGEVLTEGLLFTRRSRVAIHEMHDSLGDLRIDAICHPSQDLYTHSWNLLGSFLEHHNRLRVDDKDHVGYLNYWNPGDQVFSPNEITFDVIDMPSIFLPVFKVHEKQFIYGKNGTNETGISRVRHLPIVCNFWHFQLGFYDQSGLLIDRNGPNWTKRAAKAFLDSTLKKYCTDQFESYLILESKCYRF